MSKKSKVLKAFLILAAAIAVCDALLEQQRRSELL